MSDKSRFRLPFLKSSPVVPLVRLEGAISATPSRFDRALNLAGVGDALDKAFTVKKAKAVALVINSPGGAPVQSNLIHRRIRELADKHDKQVLVFCEDLAASGGYWIALAGDELYADAGSIVGSIGVISASFGFTGLMEKAGVERTASASKTSSMTRAASAKKKAAGGEKKADSAPGASASAVAVEQVDVDLAKKGGGCCVLS